MARGRARQTWRIVVGIGLSALFLAGCGGRGIYHTVRPGETLFRIGKAYGVSAAAIAKANDIADASRIEVGQRLRIPGADKHVPVGVVAPRDVALKPGRGARDPLAKRIFTWPIKDAVVTSEFGPRGRSFHDGIDIGADVGTEVMAAGDGEVVYADELRGYGRLIIVRHADGYATVYAHNRENRVRDGEHVRRGQAIASVGETGRATAPNLHFEVRKDNVAQNPIFYLVGEPRQVAVTRQTMSRE